MSSLEPVAPDAPDARDMPSAPGASEGPSAPAAPDARPAPNAPVAAAAATAPDAPSAPAAPGPSSAGLEARGVGKSFAIGGGGSEDRGGGHGGGDGRSGGGDGRSGGGGEVVVLRDLDLRLAAGETLAVVGPSGSGKSTLLHVLGTLERPTAGTVTLAGEDLYGLPEAELARLRNQRIGFVFQDSYLLPQYSVIENVLLPALAVRSGRSARRAARQRAAALLERVGLAARLRHRPAELSGGERQRAAIARALLNHPALVLCDEPTGSLDHANAAAATDLLFELVRQEGVMLVIATHSRELAARCGRCLELRDGRCYEI